MVRRTLDFRILLPRTYQRRSIYLRNVGAVVAEYSLSYKI